MIDLLTSLLLTFTLTVYAPDAGGINGTGITADGAIPEVGMAACGFRYKFGTVFELIEKHDLLEELGLPKLVECHDRGSMIGNAHLDLVIKTGDVVNDLRIARTWGKRRVNARVWPNMAAYRAASDAAAHANAINNIDYVNNVNYVDTPVSAAEAAGAAMARRTRAGDDRADLFTAGNAMAAPAADQTGRSPAMSPTS